MAECYNFAPGPAMLPKEVMQQAQKEFVDFKGGMSAMEVSHRHRFYKDMVAELDDNLKKLLSIPDNYQVLWMTGGATAQFSFIPLNLIGDHFDSSHGCTADYFLTGYWSKKASVAASKYLNVHVVTDNTDNKHTFIAEQSKWKFSDKPLYTYYTPNETISGLRFGDDFIDSFTALYSSKSYQPPLVADMTSCILSEPIDISKYGIIFAAAQKNIGPSGATLVIIRDDLLADNKYLPDLYSYKKLAESLSLLNTPPTYNMYIMSLVIKWLLSQGGLEQIKQRNIAKAKKLYDYLDSSSFYYNNIVSEYRSIMNATFYINQDYYSSELEAKFIKQTEAYHLYNLEGHRSIGGFRASIYNAMPTAGIDKLINFLDDFAVRNSKK